MELTAVIEALKCLKETCDVEIYCDSAYIVNAFNNDWITKWKNNGWINSSKDEVKNIALWKELDSLNDVHSISWIKVKGHSDNLYNDKCDKLATDEIKKMKANKE